MFAGKSLGTKYRADGYTPKKPVMIIPGLCSSCLKVMESPYEPWVGKRIWLSMSSIGFEKMWAPVLFGRGKKKSSAPPTPSNDGSNEVEEALKRRWLAHMCLAADGVSDPEGIKLRAVKGLKGCKYLDPGAITDVLSYVMGPLAEMLEDLGYEDGVSIDASPYDWRLPPYRLEERDGYFTELQERIERMYRENDNTKVVIIAHSLGNRVTHYFARFMEKKCGREWASKYLDNWLAIGPLWLGAPKLLRAIITGDRMGLEAFLFPHEGITLARSLGSTPWMFPYIVPEDHEFQTYSQLKDTSTGKYVPFNNKEILIEGGAEVVYNRYRDFFEGDPLVGSQEEMLKPPPVDRMYAIYGINLKTETFYFFKENKSKKKITDYVLDSKGSMSNFKCEGGVAYETKDTRQNSLKGQKRGGDGTVPYPSLSYCKKWKSEMNVRIAEIEGADHREILKNKTFLQLVLEYVSQAPPPSLLPVTFNDLEFSVKYEIKGKKLPRTLVLDHQYIRTKQSSNKEIRQYYGNVSNIILDEVSNDVFFIEYENCSKPATYQSDQSATIVQEIAARCRYIVEAKASYTEDRNEYGQTALHVCSIKNDVGGIIDLLKGPIDINAVDLNGNTPLISAAEKGNLDVMIVLLQQSNIDVNKQANNNKSVIHHMSNMRVVEDSEDKWGSVMDVLKTKNIDLNVVADFGETPLHQATKVGKIFIIQWLIENNCQLNVTNNVGETPLHYAVRVSRKDIVELLLKSGADRHKEAPSIGSPLALAKKTDADLMAFIRDFTTNTGRKSMCTGGRSRSQTVGGRRDEHGRTPLHVAATEDRLDQVFSLLLKNASVNDIDKNGWTPLHCAANNGHLDVLTVLTNSYGVDLNAQTDSGSTVMHYVLRMKQHDTPEQEENYLRMLDVLKKKGASMDMQASRGITPLHEAALRGNVLGLKWLIDQGINLQQKTEIGFSALHFAVQSKSLELVKLLIENNANPIQPSQAGTPVAMAKDIDPEIFNYLSAAPVPKVGIPPVRPPRRLTTSTHRTSFSIGKPIIPVAEDESTGDGDGDGDEDDGEVIYTLDEQDEEDVPGSVNEVIPLAQRRCSTIINTHTRASYSVIFTKPPVGTRNETGGPNLNKPTIPMGPLSRPAPGAKPTRAPRLGGSKPPSSLGKTMPIRTPSISGNDGHRTPPRVMPTPDKQRTASADNIRHTPPRGGPPRGRGMPTRGIPSRGRGMRGRGSISGSIPGNPSSPPVAQKPRTPSPKMGTPPVHTPLVAHPPIIRAASAQLPASVAALPVGSKFCMECGIPRVPGSKFCGECGNRF